MDGFGRGFIPGPISEAPVGLIKRQALRGTRRATRTASKGFSDEDVFGGNIIFVRHDTRHTLEAPTHPSVSRSFTLGLHSKRS